MAVSKVSRLPDSRSLGSSGRTGREFGLRWWFISLACEDPLYTPSQILTLNWSAHMGRQGARKYYQDDEDSIVSVVSAAIESWTTDIEALEEIVTRASAVAGNRSADEVLGYTRLLLGDVEGAKAALSLTQSGAAGAEWEEAIIARSARMLELVNVNPNRAIDQLKTWRDVTRQDLGLIGTIPCDSPNL